MSRAGEEEVQQIVRAFEVGRPDSLVVVIPKEVREEYRIAKGTKFYMKVDRYGRLVYEPLKSLVSRTEEGNKRG